MIGNKEKFNNNINSIVKKMFEVLPKRSKHIITERFDLNGNGAKTLDSIGKKYGITRERVRQIEVESLLKLKNEKKKIGADLIFEYIKKSIENSGGVVNKERLVDFLFKKDNSPDKNKQMISLFFLLDDQIKGKKGNKFYKEIYFCKNKDVNRFKEVINIVECSLKKNRKNMNFDEIVKTINEKHNISTRVVKSYLDANKIILKNILGQWGHEKWSVINPKNIKDKIYLVFKKEKTLLHFIEITNKINKIWGYRKKANKQTVHNELIKDDRFVLVGRGIYALKEWGYKEGTVLDVMLKIFIENGNSKISQEEIIRKVLEKRKVKKNTIIINLQNKKYFKKLPDKLYKLK